MGELTIVIRQLLQSEVLYWKRERNRALPRYFLSRRFRADITDFLESLHGERRVKLAHEGESGLR